MHALETTPDGNSCHYSIPRYAIAKSAIGTAPQAVTKEQRDGTEYRLSLACMTTYAGKTAMAPATVSLLGCLGSVRAQEP